MTVVLAVSCAQGIVIASDGQATDLSAGNLATATKSVVQKLFPLGGNIVWGATGSAGLIQRFDANLRGLDQDTLRMPVDDLRHILAEQQRQLQRQAVTEVVQGVPNASTPLVEPLFAGYTDKRAWILEVTAGGEDTVYDDMYAVGSGGVFAKQALAGVAHYDLPNRSMDEAQLIAWRAIDDCIAGSAFGIGHPIRMFSVTEKGAVRLDDAELRGVEDSVNGWKESELDALRGLGFGSSVLEVPADPGISPEPETNTDGSRTEVDQIEGSGSGE
jgi:proteasome beta subunit